ncbi:hypothetical protein CHCC20442_1819 [Bacillus licheniformis]|nr:hypothetical protein LI17339_06335 [Bacillus licheniformis LMG 17339]TWK03020.1 hypothetical protein CHCC20442_1819 [Bacillus licheniformis]TWK04421.1 hypothetical protein CHCC20487_3578 [Bacillus licheniformis]TWN10989.1 hypothetical protein CHCC14564_3541 [Bacillus licheniformis LMG 17339]
MKGNLILQQDGLRFDQRMFYDENIVHKQLMGGINSNEKTRAKR